MIEEKESFVGVTNRTFHIRRHDPAGDDEGHFQEYHLDVPRGQTVLEALIRIQAEQDGTLAFRYACRGAVCGSCAMLINGQVDLACRRQVHRLAAEPIRLEPLSNFRVLKDLIVEFNQAAASSLDIAVIGIFYGGAAPDYFGVRRLMNRLAVDVCNAHDWVIPFNQVSVHMETPVQLDSRGDKPLLTGS